MAWSPSCRLATELGLVALIVCLAAFGVSAVLRAALDGVPPPAVDAAVSAPTPAGLDPLEADEGIAARDIFNPPGRATGGESGGGEARLWGGGVLRGGGPGAVQDGGGPPPEALPP